MASAATASLKRDAIHVDACFEWLAGVLSFQNRMSLKLGRSCSVGVRYFAGESRVDLPSVIPEKSILMHGRCLAER